MKTIAELFYASSKSVVCVRNSCNGIKKSHNVLACGEIYGGRLKTSHANVAGVPG